jgi:outer membrane protein
VKCRWVTVLALAAQLAASVPALAGTKIGYVNIKRLMQEAPAAQRALKTISEEFAARDQELSKMQEQLRNEQNSMETNALTVSESTRKTQERNLNALSIEFQRKQTQFKEDLNRRRDEELRDIRNRINRAVNNIAEAEHYDIIFQDVVWANPRIDITDAALKALEADEPSGPPSK